MAQLNNLYVSSSYQGLLKMTDSTSGLTNTLQTIQTGDGDNSPLQMSFTEVNISGSFFINNVPITNGTNGTSGTSGSSGSDGSSGTSGSNGTDGSSGTSGSNGSDGSSGTSGTDGSTGSSGSDGSSGTSGSNGSDGSSGTSGSNGSDGSSGSSGTDGTSGSSGSDGTSGTSGTSFQSPYTGDIVVTGSIDITGQYLVNGVPVSGSGGGDRNGLITTGSLGTSQGITGSLTDFGGNIYIAQSGQTVPFRITGSEAGGNIIMGFNGRSAPTQTELTGSWSITGSNNIIMNGLIPDNNYFSEPGFKAYLSGSNNILFGQPGTQNGILVSTSSVMLPTMNSNILGGYVNLTFTSSSLAKPTFSNNFSLNQIYINHPSGSVGMINNIIHGSLTSEATKTTLGLNTSITSNNFINSTILNHNSSSITYQGNLGGAITVTNNYSSSVSTAVNNITVVQNTFGGTTNTLVVSGSNSGTRRSFNSNIIYGRSNEVNSIYSGSFTGGHLVATSILGQNLIVSASHTSTTVGGTVMVGRYNATGSLQESSQDTVFVVGTGTAAGSRRNALRIDSNNNSNFTGSVNISGSLTLNGTSFSSATSGTSGTSGSNGTNGSSGTSGLTDKTGLITTGSLSQNTQNITGSVIITGSLYVTNKINDLKIWTGSAFVNSIGIGTNTLQSQSGSDVSNIAIGNGALSTNVTGSSVVAIGGGALGNSVAGFNVAIGSAALGANTTGRYNIAIGQSSYQANTVGEGNTAIGWNSGVNNITGSTNTIIGSQALSNNASGSGNVAIGYSAGYYSTGSNGFYIGNDNYGGLNTEQEKSMMYGEFNGTTANQNLRINANTKIIGDVMFSSGSNKTMGTVALDGGNPGTATVSNSLVTANSLIFLTKQTLNHTNGYVAVSSKGTGTFTITSNHNGDADTVAYQIINPA